MASDLGLQQELIVVYCDSQSAIHLTKNQMFHKRTKHIVVRMYFIRDMIAQSASVVKKIPMVDNHVDMMTKFISTVELKHCLDLIGVSSI